MNQHEPSKYYLKYLKYCEHFNRAHHLFDISETGDPNWIVHSWHELLLAEEAIYWRKPTARQQEAQKLWQQRGLLERTYKNLQAVLADVRKNDPDCKEQFHTLINAVNEIYWLIQHNKKKFTTISKRIPS